VAGVVLQVAAEKKWRVPEELTVISLNDLGVAEKLLPPGTATHIAPDKLGRKAAQVLIDQLDNGAMPPQRDIVIPPRLLGLHPRERGFRPDQLEGGFVAAEPVRAGVCGRQAALVGRGFP